MLMFWGRGLAIGGLVALILSAGPALLLSLLPAGAGENFFGTLAALLSLTIAPLSLVAFSVGVLLVLLARLRRGP